MAETIDRNQWLGKIPDDWKLVKGRYIFKQRSERGNSIELQLLSPTQKYGVVPQSLYEELSGFSAVKLDEKTNLNTLKTIHFGDYCISLRSFQGGFEYSEYEGVCSPAYQIFYPTISIERRYYKYLFKDQCFIDKMNSFTLSLRDGKNIAFSDFGNTYLPVPPIDVQEKIAEFLDEKCAEIDALYSDIEKQVETLEEYKKSVITEAVTKGLNPDVEMKDSGNFFIGEIPEHWNLNKMNRVCNIITDYVASGSFAALAENVTYLDYPDYAMLIRTADISGKGHTSQPVYIDENSYNFLSNSNLFGGEIVLPNIGASVGDVYIVPKLYERMSLAPNSIMFKTNQNDMFYYYFFASNAGRKMLLDIAQSTAQAKFNKTELRQMKVPEPTLAEQDEIVEYLDSKCLEIDGAIKDKKEQLEVLEEYKKSLIYEYVTGKKEIK